MPGPYYGVESTPSAIAKSSSDPNQLTLWKGLTFRVSFQKNNSSGVAINLAEYGASFSILNRPGGAVLVTVTDQTTIDPITLLPFTSGDAPVLIQPGATPAIGLVTVRLGADITLSIRRTGAYAASIYSLTDSTEVQPLASGPLLVLPVGADTSEAPQYQ